MPTSRSLLTAAQKSAFIAQFPALASVANEALQGDLSTQRVVVNVPTEVTRNYRKIILPGGRTVTIAE